MLFGNVELVKLIINEVFNLEITIASFGVQIRKLFGNFELVQLFINEVFKLELAIVSFDIVLILYSMASASVVALL